LLGRHELVELGEHLPDAVDDPHRPIRSSSGSGN
jgi:hypothetical protein